MLRLGLRLLLAIIFTLCLVAAAAASSLLLTGFGDSGVAVAPSKSLTRAGSLTDDTASATVSGTLSGITLLTGDVMVLIGTEGTNPTVPIITAATINTVALTSRSQFSSSGGQGSAILDGAAVAGSSSLVVSATFTSGSFQTKMVTVWILHGVSTTPVSTSADNAGNFTGVSVQAGDFIVFGEMAHGQDPLTNSPTQAPTHTGYVDIGDFYSQTWADWTVASTSGAFSLGAQVGNIAGAMGVYR